MSDWFKNWFASGEYHTVYKHRDSADVKQFWGTFVKHFSPAKDIKILDAACGPGRYSAFLSELGYDITGFDLSMPLLKFAFDKIRNTGTTPKLFRSDIRNVPVKAKFDLVLNMFTSFGYFEGDEENFRFVKRAGEVLKPGGVFVLDYLNDYHVSNSLVPESEKIIEDKVIKEKRFIRNGRVEKEIEIISGDKSVKFLESVKLYSNDQMLGQLEQSGYKIREIWGEYGGEAFDRKSSSRLIILFSP